jgi:hypothetical protein
MTNLIETLWELLIENSLLRWFFIGLLIGLCVVGYMIAEGSDISAADALMGIVVTGFLVLGLRLAIWYARA